MCLAACTVTGGRRRRRRMEIARIKITRPDETTESLVSYIIIIGRLLKFIPKCQRFPTRVLPVNIFEEGKNYILLCILYMLYICVLSVSIRITLTLYIYIYKQNTNT